MPIEKRYKFLEHTADAYIAVYGRDLEEAFENAALAMFDIMVVIEKVEPRVQDEVEVDGHDQYALLYNWLEELLIRFEIKNNLYSSFNVLKIKKTPMGFKLNAKIWGEPYDAEKHDQKVGVKAVTYHRMEILRKPTKVTIKIIFDI